MVLFWLLRPLLDKIPLWAGLAVFGLLTWLTWNIQNGQLGFAPIWSLQLPASWYQSNWLMPLGFVPNGFFSADYFPLLPWVFVFFAGSLAGVPLKEGRFPAFVYPTHVRWLAAVGRHTLWIYLLHQPVIYGVLSLIFH